MRHVIMLFVFLLASFPLQARTLSAGSMLNIPVYEGSSLSGQKFEIIGKVTVQAGTMKDLRKVMSNLARRKGGDAVLQYEVVDHGSTQLGTVNDGTGKQVYGVGSISLPMAEGVIVNFVRSGGVTAIDESTPVPVLDQ